MLNMMKLVKLLLGFIIILLLISRLSFSNKKDISNNQVNILSIEYMSSIIGGSANCFSAKCTAPICGDCEDLGDGNYFETTNHYSPPYPYNNPADSTACCYGKVFLDVSCSLESGTGLQLVHGCVD